MNKISVVNPRTFVAITAALMGVVACARGDTFSFLGSSASSWVGYAGATNPILNTFAPGSIVDNPATGSSYGRLTNGFGAFPGAWRAGDSYTFRFDGVVSNNTAFRAEFNNGASSVAGLLGLQFVIVNGGANNADSVQINALGGTFASLFDNGNLGGAGGVGTAQRVIANLTISILPGGTTALVSGSLAGSLGNLWTGPETSISLGIAPTSIFAGVNLNAGAGVSGINTFDFALTPVPEPGTALLFGGLGLATWFFGRRVRRRS